MATNKIKKIVRINKFDETAYLMSSENNKKHLLKGMKEVEENKTTPIVLENLWK